MSDGRTYRLGAYEVEIVEIVNDMVRYRYLNPSPTMKREADGDVYGRMPVAAFTAQNRRGRG